MRLSMHHIFKGLKPKRSPAKREKPPVSPRMRGKIRGQRMHRENVRLQQSVGMEWRWVRKAQWLAGCKTHADRDQWCIDNRGNPTAFVVSIPNLLNAVTLDLPLGNGKGFVDMKWFEVHTIYGADGEHKTPYMTRVRVGPGRGWFRIHIFHRGDADPDPHDHPWSFWTFPLTTYIEEEVFDCDVANHVTRRNIVRRFQWHFRPATHTHRVLARTKEVKVLREMEGEWHPGTRWLLTPGKIITVVVLGKEKTREWGFLKNRDGHWCWEPWRSYIFDGGKHTPCMPLGLWKVISVDNFARESVADHLVAENLTHAEAEVLCNAQNDPDRYTNRWHQVVEQSYRLSRGMEDLV